MPLSTQQFLLIKQIRDGVLLLKDNSLRGIMMVSSLNFALKSVDEQDAIIYQFQTFLNSLDFPTQIVIQSRKVNITGYLDKIKEIAQKQTNELLRHQTEEYRKFIEKLVSQGTIMSKSFYLVVPFYLSEAQTPVAGGTLFKIKAVPKLTEEVFQICKSQLYQRMEYLALGLRRCGLWSIPLTNEELVELFWSLYHPKEAQVGYYPQIPPELIQQQA